MSHHKDIRTSENVESHYIDNQTMCISIPRWNLWFELKAMKMEKLIKTDGRYWFLL